MEHQGDLRPSVALEAEVTRYPDALPVFIIGSVRSGTSAMMHALREGAGIPGFNEGGLATLLPVLLAAIRGHYNAHIQSPATMLGSVSHDYMAASIKNLFGEAFVETMGTGRWLDKTPGGSAIINTCPLLVEIFPNASFVFCRRRGVENVLSRQRKFPEFKFEDHCHGWSKTMEAWLEVKPRLGASAIEVDQQEMAISPGGVAERVGRLLGLSAAQCESVAGVLRNKRVEQTRAAQDEAPVSLADTGWSSAEQDRFTQICGPMMQAFGYDPGDTAVNRRELSYKFFVPVSDSVAERENMEDKRGFKAVDASRFAMTANAAGEPAAGVRYKQVQVARFRRFSARLRVIGRDAEANDALVFAFTVQGRRDCSIAFTAEQIVTKEQGAAHWSFDLPELHGDFDAVLSLRPVGPAPRRLSGLWIDAQLLA